MENVLKEILEGINGIKTDISGINNRLDNIETRLDRLETKVDKLETKVDKLETKVDDGFAKVDERFDTLTKGIGNLVTNDIAEGISSQLREIKTEVSIIKSAVGEHEIDIRYLKKAK